MTDAIELAAIHRLKNQLAIVLGFCELVLTEMTGDDPHRDDLVQIQKAGHAALEILRDQAKDANENLLGGAQ